VSVSKAAGYTARIEPVMENCIFAHRFWILAGFVVATLFLGLRAMDLRLDASYTKMIPTNHPYIVNYLQHQDDLAGLGNALRVTVSTREGDIFNAHFLARLREIQDELFYIPGVERAWIQSIWAPTVRWTEVTEDGFIGGQVIPEDYDGSAASLDTVRDNLGKSGQIGTLVANDFRSALIYVPLQNTAPESGEPLNYRNLSELLEERIRDKYQDDGIHIRITGFAKLTGDLIEGASIVMLFFMGACVVVFILLLLYSRCLRNSALVLLCALVAVVWQLGLLSLFGIGLDPYSMLVPFLVFAIAVSHGVQLVGSIITDASRGVDRMTASRNSFRTLFYPALTALMSDGIGFVTLVVIDIEVIKGVAYAASIGVATIALTNLALLPVLSSFLGVSKRGIDYHKRMEVGRHPFAHYLAHFTQARYALLAIGASLLLVGWAAYQAQSLQVGDLDEGAPELRPDSRYNLDQKFLTENYSTSTDVFVVMAKTPADGCTSFEALTKLDRLHWEMSNLPGVQAVSSLSGEAQRVIVGMNEGNLRWLGLSRDPAVLNASISRAPEGLFNRDCSLSPVLIYLNDHKAETLNSVVAAVQDFSDRHNSEGVRFLMAAGNAGIEAATNDVIKHAQIVMLVLVYAVVLVCLLTFRSLKAVICIMLPLMMTSLLAQALMALLGFGVKVATLPVISLGVGIGVDYGIYIYARLKERLDAGESLEDAYYAALKASGRAVAFTAITLAICVGSWAFSPIKFQADMGVLLAFMFLWNMLGALLLLPALAWLIGGRRKAVGRWLSVQA